MYPFTQIHIVVLLLLLMPLAAQGQPLVVGPAGSAKAEEIKIVGPGLTLWRFPRHASQITITKSTGYVPYTDLGKPLKAPRTVMSISKWEKPLEENAVLTGYIKIDKPGLYGFRTDSDYDRNELIVDGKIVCKFGDGANKGQTVELRAGLLPIVSVGYIDVTTDITVQWLLPGETVWADIPNKLLSHEKAVAPK